MYIGLVTPAPPHSRNGNRVTANRWAGILRSLGHRVTLSQSYDGQDFDLLVAIHALRSAEAVAAFKARRPASPVVVLLAGTDVYGPLYEEGGGDRPRPGRPFGHAPTPRRRRAQAGAQGQGTDHRPVRHAHAHVRPVAKRPPLRRERRGAPEAGQGSFPHSQRNAPTPTGVPHPRAAAWRPDEPCHDPPSRRTRCKPSTVRLDERSACVARPATAQEVPGDGDFIALGREELTLSRRRRSTASRYWRPGCPATWGCWADDYPGYFPVGDSSELRRLLLCCESDPSFLACLREAEAPLRSLLDPQRECADWAALLNEVAPGVS